MASSAPPNVTGPGQGEAAIIEIPPGGPEKSIRAPAVYPIMIGIGASHLLNDTLQAAISASYPILRESLHLSFAQIGWIAFTLYFTSSVMQPLFGAYADKKPIPYLLPLAMTLSMLGMLGIAAAPGYGFTIAAVVLVGLASAMFHPEGSRIAHMAAGSRRGLAQSMFQTGGNLGAAMAPIMTALVFFPFGQQGAAWFCIPAAAGIALAFRIARWYAARLKQSGRAGRPAPEATHDGKRRKRVVGAIAILIMIAFARTWFGSSITTYFAFYLTDHFGMTFPRAQMYIFVYMAAGLVGTLLGGPLSDRLGRKNVILFSVLGAAPFAFLLPHVGPLGAYPLLFMLGLINQSSFSVTVVYVQELVPGKIGTVSGLITGLSFGLGALGAVSLGALIDKNGLTAVLTACSFLPLLGVVGLFLPSDRKRRDAKS